MHNDDLTRATWRKSSYSGNSGNCVEIATTRSRVAVRDSKAREEEVLILTREAWRSFLANIVD
jgi:hypothetical protein